MIMFTVEFPYDIGTFVTIKKNKKILGTIVCYNCVDGSLTDEPFLVVVSGYKDSWCGEYFLNEIEVASDKEVEEYKKRLGIKE